LPSPVSDITLDHIPQKAKNLLENFSLLTVSGGMNRCLYSLFRLENNSSTLMTKIHVISIYVLCFLAQLVSFGLLMCLLEFFTACYESHKKILKQLVTSTVQYKLLFCFWL